MSEVAKFYDKLAEKKTVGYGAKVSQQVRFESFVKFVEHAPKSLLDVGCGSGDLLFFLKDRGWLPDRYVGVDVSPKMVEWTKERIAELPIQKVVMVGNADTPQEPPVEWVAGMGIFEIGTDQITLWETVRAMYARCTEGVAFTAIWKDPSKKKLDQDETFFEPFALAKELREKLTERVAVDFSYAPHCYSVYMWKSDSKWLQEWKKTGGW